MSQKLEADHTLESAKKVRQHEAVREHQVQLKSRFLEEGSPAGKTGNRGPGVRLGQRFNRRTKPEYKPTESGRSHPITRNKCTRCGRGPHSKQQCLAREATCHHCKKKGHKSVFL